MAHIALGLIQECRSDGETYRELELAVFAVGQLEIMTKAFLKHYEAVYKGDEWPL